MKERQRVACEQALWEALVLRPPVFTDHACAPRHREFARWLAIESFAPFFSSHFYKFCVVCLLNEQSLMNQQRKLIYRREICNV